MVSHCGLHLTSFFSRPWIWQVLTNCKTFFGLVTFLIWNKHKTPIWDEKVSEVFSKYFLSWNGWSPFILFAKSGNVIFTGINLSYRTEIVGGIISNLSLWIFDPKSFSMRSKIDQKTQINCCNMLSMVNWFREAQPTS